MNTLILTVCLLFGLTAMAQQPPSSVPDLDTSRNSSEDPNLKRGFDGASTFLDPTNPDCKPCQELLKSRQNFSRDMAGTYSPQSLGRHTPNQTNTQSTILNPGVKTGK